MPTLNQPRAPALTAAVRAMRWSRTNRAAASSRGRCEGAKRAACAEACPTSRSTDVLAHACLRGCRERGGGGGGRGQDTILAGRGQATLVSRVVLEQTVPEVVPETVPPPPRSLVPPQAGVQAVEQPRPPHRQDLLLAPGR